MGEPNPQNFNAVQSWVNQRITSGQFKDCTHLTVISVLQSDGRGSRFTLFAPKCERRSFEWSVPGLDDQSQLEMLFLHMGQGREVISCPVNCLCHESRVEANLAEFEAQQAAMANEKRERRWGRVKAPFGWFSNLPWQTQIAIILVAVLALSPKWVPQLIVLIKALTELLR